LMPHEATTLESLACIFSMSPDLSQALRPIHWLDAS